MGVFLPEIPELTGESAERFLEIKEKNEKLAGSIDFSKEFQAYKKIIEKSKKYGSTGKKRDKSSS